MARHLWPNTLLCAETSDSHEGGEDSTDLEMTRWGGSERVGEEGTIVRLEYVSGEVGVSCGKFGEELGGMRFVDGVPECSAPRGGRCEIVGSGHAEVVRSKRVRDGRWAYRRDSVLRPCLTGSGRWERKAVRLFMI
jgi:hypothetical protein